MPIIKKGSADNFMMMQREALQRADMSMKAKGLLAYIMSLPTDWVIHQNELVTHFTDGDKAVRSATNELIEAGYLVRHQSRGEGGHFSEVTYTAVDFIGEEPLSHYRQAVEREAGLRHADNRRLQRNTIQSNSNTKKDSTNTGERRTDETDDNYSNSVATAATAATVINRSITDNDLDFAFGPIQRQELVEYVTEDGMDVEVVADAIKLTKDSNQSSFKYTDGILKNRLAKHLLTMSAVIDNEKKRNYASDKYGDKQKKEIW